MNKHQTSLFGEQRLNLAASLEMTATSLNVYGETHRHWAIAFSGGKDSTAVVTAVAWLIETGQVRAPETLTILYADTRMELPPLRSSAMRIMWAMEQRGTKTQVVLPPIDERFYVYMFGRGVPPPSNTFRWCTSQIKVEPMEAALSAMRVEYGEKYLMLTGVRVGESAARDQRIAVSCGRNGAECGQGWFQETTSDGVADTLAPILHWRACHVWDWLIGAEVRHGFDTAQLAQVYGQDDDASEFEANARTGCVACNLASKDQTLERLIQFYPDWAYLSPLLRLRGIYAELKRPSNRKRHVEERRKDGTLSSNPQRLGPLTMEARRWGLEQVCAVQREIERYAGMRTSMSLINQQEQDRINELIEANTWPQGWTGDEVNGDFPLPFHYGRNGNVKQFLLEIPMEGA